jgi:hypothetical protein
LFTSPPPVLTLMDATSNATSADAGKIRYDSKSAAAQELLNM